MWPQTPHLARRLSGRMGGLVHGMHTITSACSACSVLTNWIFGRFTTTQHPFFIDRDQLADHRNMRGQQLLAHRSVRGSVGSAVASQPDGEQIRQDGALDRRWLPTKDRPDRLNQPPNVIKIRIHRRTPSDIKIAPPSRRGRGKRRSVFVAVIAGNRPGLERSGVAHAAHDDGVRRGAALAAPMAAVELRERCSMLRLGRGLALGAGHRSVRSNRVLPVTGSFPIGRSMPQHTEPKIRDIGSRRDITSRSRPRISRRM